MNDQNNNSKRNVDALAFLALDAWAMTIYLPIRRKVGREHIGVTGLAAAVFILIYMAITGASAIMCLLPAFLIVVVIHRLDQLQRRARGENEHTQYGGEPWLAKCVFRSDDERKCKVLGEPALSFLLGLLLLPYGDAVGGYFIAGAVALGLSQALMFQRQDRRLDDLRNGMIENQTIMRRFHEQNRRR